MFLEINETTIHFAQCCVDFSRSQPWIFHCYLLQFTQKHYLLFSSIIRWMIVRFINLYVLDGTITWYYSSCMAAKAFVFQTAQITVINFKKSMQLVKINYYRNSRHGWVSLHYVNMKNESIYYISWHVHLSGSHPFKSICIKKI